MALPSSGAGGIVPLPMTFESIRLAHRDGVSTITLDGPPVNAVSPGPIQDALRAPDAPPEVPPT